MFITHQSNRLERLFDQLAQIMRKPLSNVFAPETIIVQSQGMARWLSLELAKSLGISANLDCPFPASFIWRLFQRLDPALHSSPVSPYDPDSLVWTVMNKIEQLRGDEDFKEIRSFLEIDDSDLRAHQLAVKIAQLLDQYLMHRPEWITSWSEGKFVGDLGPAEAWQAKLWRAVIGVHGKDKHRVSLFEQFISNCDEQLIADADIPERICLFGIPALSQLHLDVFVHLSGFMDVHLFLLTPCAEFTDDLIDVRQLERMRLAPGKVDPAQSYYELGCPLLMSLGAMGLDFASMLNNYDLLGAFGDALYEAPEVGSALSLIHSDLLKGTEVALDSGFQVSEEDRSIQIHSAHSPMREVEILHDSLLELLNNNDDLKAQDIIVMVPDISQYASLIEAVFSTPVPPENKIPFSVADQSGTDPVVLAFMELLQVASSRFSASELLALLDRGAIRRCFGLSPEDMLLVKHWVVMANIRWGSGAKLQQEGQDQEIGTWQHGIDRLMLGVTMYGGSEDVFEGVLPCDAVEGSDVEILMKLCSFFEAVKGFAATCSTPKKMTDWRLVLIEALDTFLADSEENYYGVQKIQGALDDLEKSYEAAKVDFAISIKVIASVLEEKITIARDHHFLSGKVTFCQMVPMRSIPFKAICLLGMNDSSFPRQDKPLGFDLMKGRSRPGDRCRRDDDRYLFLETLLSARQNLYISYVGQNDTDHREVPPSAVVSELIDYLGWRLGLSGEVCEQRFITRHALQPFSRRYYSGELSSFSSINREIAQSLSEEKSIGGLFDWYEPKEIKVSEVALSDLIGFFHHPVKYLLKNRYDLYLDDYHDQVEDRSCFMLDNLEQYGLSRELSQAALQDELEKHNDWRYQLAGSLPQGITGSYFYEKSLACAQELKGQFEKFKTGNDSEPLAVDLEIGTIRIVGSLNGISDSGQFLYRPTYEKSIGYRDIVTTWIRHLILAATQGEGVTTFICRNGALQFSYYADAHELLADLLAIFTTGLQRPLPLFPGSSFAYAGKLWGAKNGPAPKDKALSAAREKWFSGGFYGDPECADPYLHAVYQGSDPFDDSGEYGFHALAETVLSHPLGQGEKLK